MMFVSAADAMMTVRIGTSPEIAHLTVHAHLFP